MLRSVVIEGVRYNLKDMIEDYTEAEKIVLKRGYDSLEVKAQGAELSIDETALRVAWHRLLRNENFVVVQAKPKKAAAPKTGRKKAAAVEISIEDYLASIDGSNSAPVPAKAVKAKAPAKRTKKIVKEVSQNVADRHKAQELAFRKNRGEELTVEEEAFLAEQLKKLEELLNE